MFVYNGTGITKNIKNCFVLISMGLFSHSIQPSETSVHRQLEDMFADLDGFERFITDHSTVKYVAEARMVVAGKELALQYDSFSIFPALEIHGDVPQSVHERIKDRFPDATYSGANGYHRWQSVALKRHYE